jgi:hypothetical protein
MSAFSKSVFAVAVLWSLSIIFGDYSGFELLGGMLGPAVAFYAWTRVK